MKMRTRSIIAIIVAAVAALSIIFVVVLAVIRLEPLKGMLDCQSYEIRYSSKVLPGSGTDVDYEIPSFKEVNRKYESTSMSDIIGMCGFSVFKSWSQFKYKNSPKLEDHNDWNHYYIGRDEMKSIISGESAVTEGKFSLVFRFDESADRALEVVDSNGNDYTQSYDTAIIVLSDTDGWVGDITMYVYKRANIEGAIDPNQKDDALGYNRFYPLKVGAVTTEAIDVLYDIFDITEGEEDKEPEETEEEETEEDDGHDH